MQQKPGMGRRESKGRASQGRMRLGLRMSGWTSTALLLSLLAGMTIVSCGGPSGDCDDASEDCSGDESPTPTPTAQERSDASEAGEFAADILSAATYSKLRIEVDVMEGATPDEEAFDTLVDYIKLLCNKPDGVTVNFPDDVIPADASAGENPLYTGEQFKALEATWRDHYTQGDEAVLYFLYLNGHSQYDTSDSQVVGIAYRGSSMVIFMGTVQAQSALIQPTLQKTVTVHEFGHEIGLVDNGIAMQTDHRDADHGNHCTDDSCMMYWTNNSSAISILGGDIPDFDDNCLADIAAAGGKDARGMDQPD